MNEYPLGKLRAFITTKYSDEEIDSLCFDNFFGSL